MKNFSSGKDIEQIQIDFKEQLVRSVIDTTISKVIFQPKKQEIPWEWKEAIELITKNNNLERLLKFDVRQKSLHGKSYVGFDVFDNEPIIWVCEYNARNQALRLNGQKQFAVRVVREYASIANATPILRNEVTYTINDKTYLFLGGFGINVSNQANPSYKEAKQKYEKSLDKLSSSHFPWDYVSISTPQYIIDQHKFGVYKHNLGIIPVEEMLNKDILDYGNDNYLSDWYPAEDYIPLVAQYIKYIAWELNLDHTRVIGMFSQQDIQNIKNQASGVANSNNPLDKLKQMIENYSQQKLFNAFDSVGEDNAIKKKLIIRSVGSEGAGIQVMNSHFDGEKHANGLQAVISLIYRICGYSWNVNEATGTYENVSQTQNTLRSVFETTKEKNELFTRQWKQFLTKIFYVIFKQKKTLQEIAKEFDDYVDFQIVSNLLMNEQNDWRKNMELQRAQLVSKERAINLIWPNLTDEEIQQEVELINQEKEEVLWEENNKEFDNGAFNNQKPFGSKEYNKGEDNDRR